MLNTCREWKKIPQSLGLFDLLIIHTSEPIIHTFLQEIYLADISIYFYSFLWDQQEQKRRKIQAVNH